jgi:hypothetical protein
MYMYVGQILKPAPSLLKSFVDGLKRLYVTKVSQYVVLNRLESLGDEASSVPCTDY